MAILSCYSRPAAARSRHTVHIHRVLVRENLSTKKNIFSPSKVSHSKYWRIQTLSPANSDVVERQSSVWISSWKQLWPTPGREEGLYQNTFWSKRCSGRARSCTCPCELEILLEGDVQLTPAPHVIQRTIKKLIMFGKSLVIYSRSSNVLPGELGAGQGYSPSHLHGASWNTWDGLHLK